MLGRRGYFGKRDAVILPRDNMPGVGDLHSCSVPAALDRNAAMYFEQLGMERPPVQLKNQLGDSRANG